jgi:predicted RecB family nuclease
MLCARKVSVSAAQVAGWMEHARSYSEGRAVMFGPPPPVGDAFIALDLEYDTSVWLTAVLLCEGDKLDHNYFWADTPQEEREALWALEAICATYPNLPIVTWSGCSADLPNLRVAATRHRLGHIYAEVERRHVDLFQHATRTMRIPDPELSLKAVAEYFGVPKVSAIVNGLEAQFRYHEYRSCRRPDERARLQAELVAYNRDDLEALTAMAGIMRRGPEQWPEPRANHWAEDRVRRPMPPRRRPGVRPAVRIMNGPSRRRLGQAGETPTPSSQTHAHSLPF